MQLQTLSDRLRHFVSVGLPMSVAHQIWTFASKGAIVHLQSANLYNHEEMASFNPLQIDHTAWMTGRTPEDPDKTGAWLPESEVGW